MGSFLPLFQTFFEPFVGKSDKTGCHFYHFNFGGLKVGKVAKISTYQHFSSKLPFPLYSKKSGQSCKNMFREKSGIICINYLIMQVAIVIWQTKMAAFKYKRQENESGFRIINNYQLFHAIFSKRL